MYLLPTFLYPWGSLSPIPDGGPEHELVREEVLDECHSECDDKEEQCRYSKYREYRYEHDIHDEQQKHRQPYSAGQTPVTFPFHSWYNFDVNALKSFEPINKVDEIPNENNKQIILSPPTLGEQDLINKQNI